MESSPSPAFDLSCWGRSKDGGGFMSWLLGLGPQQLLLFFSLRKKGPKNPQVVVVVVVTLLLLLLLRGPKSAGHLIWRRKPLELVRLRRRGRWSSSPADVQPSKLPAFRWIFPAWTDFPRCFGPKVVFFVGSKRAMSFSRNGSPFLRQKVQYCPKSLLEAMVRLGAWFCTLFFLEIDTVRPLVYLENVWKCKKKHDWS